MFGDVSPASADERDDADRGRDEDARSFYERERPPHHDRER
ncbi:MULTISPECIES: hypothetical protein [Actinomycetospora]|nr:hypothetical protein [Actinomycetospora soli]